MSGANIFFENPVPISFIKKFIEIKITFIHFKNNKETF